MAFNKSSDPSLFSQVLVGVVVSVLTAVTLKSLGMAEAPASITETASPPTTVRISFAAPEPVLELPPPEALLFNGQRKSHDQTFFLTSASQDDPRP